MLKACDANLPDRGMRVPWFDDVLRRYESTVSSIIDVLTSDLDGKEMRIRIAAICSEAERGFNPVDSAEIQSLGEAALNIVNEGRIPALTQAVEAIKPILYKSLEDGVSFEKILTLPAVQEWCRLLPSEKNGSDASPKDKSSHGVFSPQERFMQWVRTEVLIQKRVAGDYRNFDEAGNVIELKPYDRTYGGVFQ